MMAIKSSRKMVRRPKRYQRLGKQAGIALVSVLFVVALSVIIAVEMSGRLQLQIQRTTNLIGNRQAYWYAVGAEHLVKQQIKRINDDKNKRTNHIHSGQDWAQKGLEFPVEGGKIAGELTDLQACFNLNSLATDSTKGPGAGAGTGTTTGGGVKSAGSAKPPPPSPSPAKGGGRLPPQRKQGISFEMEAFQRLMEDLEIDEISDVPPEYLAQRLKDWLDEDGRPTGGGGMEEDDYRGLEIPYLAANTLMTSVSELRLVGGFTAKIVNKLKPFICVIPGEKQLKININTIEPDNARLVSALIKGLSIDDAQALVSGGQPDGYAKLDDFWTKSEMSQIDKNVATEAKNYFDVTTAYFTLKAQTSYGDSTFYLNSKLHVNQSKQVTVIARKFGVDL